MSDSETIKKLYIALKKEQVRVRELENSLRESIAVIGMACRFPGGADTPGRFWKLLSEGVDAVTHVPNDRWNGRELTSNDPDAPGKMITDLAGYLTDDIQGFDNKFFGISPKEAKSLDPQQRLLLETTQETFENAGIPVHEVKGTATGVYIGILGSDYASHHWRSGDLSTIDAYSMTGTSPSTASGRIAYIYGLKGPNLALDTACSSSLVCLNLAVQSLRLKESDMALVGGVNLMLMPESHVCFSKLNALSPEGRCKTFDNSADGYSRGEGCGMILVKRFSDAVRDKDRIYAVIKGSAVNQDGRSAGFTAPNGSAQEEVISKALKNAGLEPSDIDYIEAHGTGTKLGDPVEVEAISNVILKNRDMGRKLFIGSVKTNIGHLEGAAGIAGVIKTVLSLYNETIPGTLHFKTPNEHIDWRGLPITAPTSPAAWKKSGIPRHAGVSSFGFSGTNAHVIIGDPPPLDTTSQAQGPGLLVMSAMTEKALYDLIGKYIAFLETTKESLESVCAAAAMGKTHYTVRLAVIGADIHEIRNRLTAYHSGDEKTGVYTSFDPDMMAGAQKDDDNAATNARLYVQGISIDWKSVFTPGMKLGLPTYPFQRTRFWVEPPKKSFDDNLGRLFLTTEWEEESISADMDSESLFTGRCLTVSPDSETVVMLMQCLENKNVSWTRILPDAINDADLNLSEHGAVLFSPGPVEMEKAVDANLDLLCLVRRLASGFKGRFIILTENAHAVTGHEENISPVHTSLWGLGNVILSEYPEMDIVLADVITADMESMKSFVTSAVACHAKHPDVRTAYRNGKRYVQVLKRKELTRKVKSFTPASDSTWLVTGGLGSLGLTTAKALAEKGVKHIVLAGRNIDRPEKTSMIKAIEETGASVHLKSADVSNPSDVKELIDSIRAELPPLSGIAHLAGVMDIGLLKDQGSISFEKAFHAKARGAWNLHKETKEDTLDHFILFSSSAALMTTPGQGNYAAANAFLDGLALYRNKKGMAGTAINWGPFLNAGIMGVKGSQNEILNKEGLTPLDHAMGMSALFRVIESGLSRIMVVDADWNRNINFHQIENDSYYGYLTDAPLKGSLSSSEESPFLKELKETPRSGRLNRLLGYLKSVVEKSMGYEASVDETISEDTPLMEQGIDSLMAVEIRNQIGKTLRMKLPASILFEYPTLTKLSGYIIEEMFQKDDQGNMTEDDVQNDSAPLSADDVLGEIESLLDQN